MIPQNTIRGALKGIDLDRLLTRFLDSSPENREEEFAGTWDAARTAGVAQRTMQAWIEAGKVQAVRIGRKWWVWLPSLRAYLQEVNSR